MSKTRCWTPRNSVEHKRRDFPPRGFTSILDDDDLNNGDDDDGAKINSAWHKLTFVPCHFSRPPMLILFPV